MNYETIEDEIYNFSAIFFEEIAFYTEINLDFIQNNQLHMPKRNYTSLIAFLSKTLNTFKNLDKQFLNSTLNKLQTDLKQLDILYTQTKEDSSDMLGLFNSKFINYSPTLSNYAKIIIDTNKINNKNSEEFTQLKRLKQNFLNLKKIYFKIFQEIFYEERKDLLQILKQSINTKSYYLDKILWLNAKKSFPIVKHLKTRKMNENLNSKEYITFICSTMRPYTDEYRYLQSCLKVYR